MVVETVEAAPDLPQELQLSFVDHHPVLVNPEALQSDEWDLTLHEVFKDGLDGWYSAVRSCGTCIRVRTDDRSDLSGDAEPVGVSALNEVERVVVWEGEDFFEVISIVEADSQAFSVPEGDRAKLQSVRRLVILS